MRILIWFTILASFATAIPAKEVKMVHNGLVLNADLSLAPEGKISHGVVILVHGGLAHRDMSSLKYIRSLLRQKAYNVLAINLSLGISDRHGFYDCQTPHRHQNQDAVKEIDLWADWLEKQGANKIFLLAHSRGAAQSALYMSEHSQRRSIAAAVLLAPATLDNGYAGYQNDFQQDPQPLLDQAKSLIDQGKGDRLIKANMMHCREVQVTANSFYSYYQNHLSLDTPNLLKISKKPVLVIIAGDDGLVQNLDQKIDASGLVSKRIIDGADHFFRDLFSDDAVDLIDLFFKKH